MKRFLRGLLYCLALLGGITGLVVGGKLLGKYVLARLNDPYFDSFSYNDLVFSGGVIFILSLILLIFADIGLMLGKKFGPAKNADAAPKPAGVSPKTAASSSPSAPLPDVESEADQESADEKLARLLQQKKK